MSTIIFTVKVLSKKCEKKHWSLTQAYHNLFVFSRQNFVFGYGNDLQSSTKCLINI
jgi:hypoxanthine-guanine phosphoribosyltransferase